MSRAQDILFLSGPNLNMLGTRQPEIYGFRSLADIEQGVHLAAAEYDLRVDFRQTNSEAELVGWIQEARARFAGIVINGGAYTHTSVAIMDALLAFPGPVIELHLSNNFRRERFRHTSYISLAAKGIIEGFGPAGYVLAVRAMAGLLDEPASSKYPPDATPAEFGGRRLSDASGFPE